MQTDRRKAAAKARHDANPRLKCEASKAAYKINSEKMKAVFQNYYASHRDAMLAFFRKYYASHRGARLEASHQYHASHRSSRLRYFRKYHSYTKSKRVAKARYNLTNWLLKYGSVKANLLADGEVLLKLKEEFKSLHADKLNRAELEQTVGRLAVKRLVCEALQIRRKYAGFH